MLIDFLNAIAYTGAFALALVVFLGLLAKLGGPGEALGRLVTRAPLLDIVFALISWVPWLVCGIVFGWIGLAGAIVAQVCVIQVWIFGHELMHPKAKRGPRIVRYLDHKVGWLNNRTALWVTVGAFPVFWVVRLAEIILYPLFVRLLGFPKYKHGDWVNLSRHRFRGLVGHDLLWCLYCDWMTGVYSFGAEMLRNVESFWCPIQFQSKIKCENCKQDFPDVEKAWVPADGSMADVDALMHRLYDEGNMSWAGHPSRAQDPPIGPLGIAAPVPIPLEPAKPKSIPEPETPRESEAPKEPATPETPEELQEPEPPTDAPVDETDNDPSDESSERHDQR